MEDTQAPPAGDQEAASEAPTSSLSEILAYQNSDRHETHREAGVGASEEAEAAASTPAEAAPAPAAVAPPSAQAAPTPALTETPAAAPAEVKEPRWYREHMAKTNRELAASQAELERLRNAPPQQPRQAPQDLPDPLEDPGSFAERLQGTFEQRLNQFQLQTTLTLSERFARKEHGNEAFEDCKAWLSTKPDIEAWAIQQPDPWTAAFTNYQRERLAEEIGDDPNAWREKERQRIRDEMQAEFAASQANSPQHIPATPQMRAAPPPPSSGVRSAAPRDGTGRFTGPTPIGGALKNTF